MSQTKQSISIKHTNLTSLEKEVIVACLLGDGTLSKSGKFYRLRVEQKSLHKEYSFWKYDLLQRLCITQPQFVSQHDSFRFGTVGHPYISALRSSWYGQAKQVAKDFSLSPLSLAIWFMDDGTRHRNTVDISVHNFSLESINLLQKQLSLLKIETTVNHDSKGHRLYVRQSSYSDFNKLVSPYIVKCMAYKLP